MNHRNTKHTKNLIVHNRSKYSVNQSTNNSTRIIEIRRLSKYQYCCKGLTIEISNSPLYFIVLYCPWNLIRSTDTQLHLTNLTNEPPDTYQIRLRSLKGTKSNRPHYGNILLRWPPWFGHRDKNNSSSVVLSQLESRKDQWGKLLSTTAMNKYKP